MVQSSRTAIGRFESGDLFAYACVQIHFENSESGPLSTVTLTSDYYSGPCSQDAQCSSLECECCTTNDVPISTQKRSSLWVREFRPVREASKRVDGWLAVLPYFRKLDQCDGLSRVDIPIRIVHNLFPGEFLFQHTEKSFISFSSFLVTE